MLYINWRGDGGMWSVLQARLGSLRAPKLAYLCGAAERCKSPAIHCLCPAGHWVYTALAGRAQLRQTSLS